ncbi:MAG: methyltransferase domain-containing protein [Clostridia bacterium]|nr:methyltransferase domain-containing protein [Clostridia bacterium]
MEYRKLFDTIPEQFDKYRPRYSAELFSDFIEYAGIGPGKTVLELGPGTGQATDPILETGCDYHAIELGEHLFEKMKQKYGRYPNFHIVNDDFITHDFEGRRFDVIYSAATIQWIPEKIAFTKTYELLKPGGTLAMILVRGDYETPNEELYDRIQKIYAAYWRPEAKYSDMRSPFSYTNAVNYGYVDFEKREFFGKRVFTADEYVSYCGTHVDHIDLPEPSKSLFYNGLREAVLEAGDRIEFYDTYVLYLAKKPK